MYEANEIAIVAREYWALGSFKCRWAIQRNLALATAAGDWNEIRKWYRVQICVRRLSRGETCAETPQFARRPTLVAEADEMPVAYS